MANLTNIPASRVPLIDSQTGLMTREWFRFFQNLFINTGGGTTEPVISVSAEAPLVSSGGLTPTFSIGSPTEGYVMTSGANGKGGWTKTLRLNGASNYDYTVVTAAFPAGNNVLVLPKTNGNLVSTGDTGTVNATMLAVNAVTPTAVQAQAITQPKLALQAVAQSNIGTNVAGTGPAFSAYANATQSVPTGVFIKMVFSVKEFDTNNNYDPATGRFTPTVAGYYQVNATLYNPNATALASITKNGVEYKRGTQATGASLALVSVSALVYCNGTTDYLEMYTYQTSGATQTIPPTATGISAYHYFQAFLARAA